jgi:hypothetical protein
MNTNDPWKRLADTARRPRTEADAPAEIPFGFDTRVLAHAKPPRQLTAELLGRLALNAIPLATAVWVTCWLTLRADPTDRLAATDPIMLADIVFVEEAGEP